MGEQEYTASVMSLGFYGGLLQELVSKLGLEEALRMHGEVGRGFGLGAGEELKQAVGGGTLDVAAVDNYNSSVMKSLGLTFTATRSGRSVSFQICRCPMYDALASAGFGHEVIQKICAAFDGNYYKSISTVVPNVSASVEFKQCSDGCCEERWEVS